MVRGRTALRRTLFPGGRYGQAVADTGYSHNDRVEAAQDLPGVPEGTPGRVVMVTGLAWIRYRVRFDNGTELNLLDQRYLRPVRPKAHA
jgi:hypothetical protein